MAKRTRRPRDQLPNCYYEGFLEKRPFRDEAPRKVWTALCGNVLFFFNDKRDCGYIEKVDLSGFISVTDDTRPDCNLEEARFNLRMKNGSISFTAPNTEARDLWKGYIQSVAELAVPTSLNLLPGQIHMLTEAVEKEKERKQNISPSADPNSNSYITVQPDMPACYHNVSRLESELLLDREAKRGNLLLRPGSDGNSFAVSTRQAVDRFQVLSDIFDKINLFSNSYSLTAYNNIPVFKHYRVIRKHDGGFIIDVDPQVPCATLQDVINYLVETTDGNLIPLIIEEPYEKKISYFSSDNENGEKNLQQALPNVASPPVPPKPVSRNTPSPQPEAAPVEESWYLNDNWNEVIKETEDSSPNKLPQRKYPKISLMPPTPVPRKVISSSATNQDLRPKAISDTNKQIPLAALSELKLKLEQKAKNQE